MTIETVLAGRISTLDNGDLMNNLKRCIAQALVVCILGAGMPLPANAGIVTTGEIAASAEHDRVGSFLDRAEVRAQLQTLGVDATVARARVAALTNEEAKELAARIDELPAGGVVGALVFIFVLLLVTDLLGLTKVFPFTRSVR
jgi:hypothetical protein